ncbi:hypothetical protein B4168_0211 [Anoxybacillus flavithermus]|nr:hypothetical protein GT20_1601 [Parageobacillus thermoglucosidasius TNO-09.020]KYD18242.1 hypothetical protein B4168_0211 [Anoxybacillus flavithermus]OAO88873.1 hypothetical protein GT23_0113 [Parageobacillus thermoglucosidasius]
MELLLFFIFLLIQKLRFGGNDRKDKWLFPLDLLLRRPSFRPFFVAKAHAS